MSDLTPVLAPRGIGFGAGISVFIALPWRGVLLIVSLQAVANQTENPMKPSILAILISLICSTANAAPQEVAPASFAQARQQFMAAYEGKGSDAAIDTFHALGASQPGHPLFLAYEGASNALKGRDASMPWDKMKYTEKGADQLEKALALLTPAHDEALFQGSPESVEVRLLAANTLLALPDFMNRRSQGKRALEAALASPALALSSTQTRASLFAAAARLAGKEQRSKDEISWLQKVLALPDSPQHARAVARLKELGL